MFADDVTNWLNANATAGSKAYVANHVKVTLAELDRLGIPPDNELAYFYSHYGVDAVRGLYELNEIDQVQDATN